MPQTYIHYFGNESSDSLLEAKGILKENKNNEEKDSLKPIYCINCNEIKLNFPNGVLNVGWFYHMKHIQKP
ncbi:MAG TPA: hypothetical protein VJ697_15015 [Nitrososphaeraceae archaeon]|nr:hypothetical protein [Nitrososphaeraceae archaeon]